MKRVKPSRAIAFVAKWLGIVVTVLMFMLCVRWFYADLLTKSEALMTCTLYAVSSVLLNHIYNSYSVGKSRIFELVYSQSLADVIAAGIAYCGLILILEKFPRVTPMMGVLVVQTAWSTIWCLGVNRLYFRFDHARKTAVVYEAAQDLQMLTEIGYFDQKYEVVKKIRAPRDAEKLLGELQGIESLFVLGETKSEIRSALARFCVDKGVTGYITPDISEIIMASAQHMPMYSVPIMRIRRAQPRAEYLAIKRLFDVLCALIASVAVSPIMLGTAVAIKCYDGGPVFYRQVRLTKDGKQFKILKFRSMRVDAERDGVARLASVKDDRITPVGHFIRACRIDELPQLYNILAGDMTIVGPRPERPEIAADYEKEMPEFALRLQVKAGLTGLAQVYGRYNTDPQSKLEMDLMYINKMSVVEDLKLIFATVKILFMKDSTAGVGADQKTALKDDGDSHHDLSA